MLGTSLVAGAGAVGLAAVGCGDDDDGADSGSGTAGTATKAGDAQATFQQNATLRSGIGSDIGGADPHLASGTGGGNWPNYTTHFSTLHKTDPENSDTVGFAADWKWVDNNSALQLTARPGVKFHNGEVLDA